MDDAKATTPTTSSAAAPKTQGNNTSRASSPRSNPSTGRSSDEEAPTGGGTATRRAPSPRATANRALSPRTPSSRAPSPRKLVGPSNRGTPRRPRAESVDQAQAPAALDDEAAKLHQQLIASEYKATRLAEREQALEAKLLEIERERETERHEAETRFEDMKAFMKGICDNLKAANTELNERLAELLQATKAPSHWLSMQTKSVLGAQEETIQRLHAENAQLRLRLAPPRKGCLKGGPSLEEMTPRSAGEGGVEVDALGEDGEGAGTTRRESRSPGARALAEAEKQADVQAEAGRMAMARAGAAAAAAAEVAAAAAAEAAAATGLSEDDTDLSEDDTEPAEEATQRAQAVAAPAPPPRMVGLRLPPMGPPNGIPLLGLAVGGVPTLDFSRLALPTAAEPNERPDEDGRRPPTPPSIFLERLEAARQAAAAAAAAALAPALAPAESQAGATAAAAVPDGESPSVQPVETKPEDRSIVAAVVDWFKGSAP